GKRQWQFADLRTFEHEFQRLLVELASGASLCHKLRDRLIDDLVITFAGDAADDVTRGIDQHLRRPRAHAVALPDRVFRIVVNRMLDLVTQDDAPDVFGFLFVLKLRGVNADHDQLIGVLCFELFEIRNDVDAVDAAVGPEIKQDNFALERGDRERLVSVEPAAAAGDFGRAYFR